MNVYEKITEAVIEQLQQGVIPWERNYVSGNGAAINYVSRKPYSFLNQMLLGKPGEYLTMNQVTQLGGHVRAGSRARFVVFFKRVEKITVVDGEEVDKGFPILRYYNVFHIDDVEGIESRIEQIPYPDAVTECPSVEDVVGGYVSREGIRIVHEQGCVPAYIPSSDTVRLPLKAQFLSTERYYGTLLHELVHSTGAESRLNRDSLAGNNGGDHSREELVAAMGSIMAGNRLGVENMQTRTNNVAYIQGWISALQNDRNMVYWASSRAEKAVKYFFGEITGASVHDAA